MNKLLALGCSHTAGVGIQPQEIYATLVASHLELDLINLSVAGGNHQEVETNLIEYLWRSIPSLIIIQWPNPFRITTWNQNKKILENVSNRGKIFDCMLIQGGKNFFEPWIQTIIICNLLCKAKNISTINIFLESVDKSIHQRLEHFDIVLHQDDKKPGKSWIFDSNASDNLHHSSRCHKLWAERIIGLINENTQR